MKFYTSFYQRGDHILARWFENGEEYTDKWPIDDVVLYTTNKTDSPTPYTTVNGQPLFRLFFNDPEQARNFVKSSPETNLYGTLNLDTHWAAETFGGPDACPFDESLIRTCIIDIEVESENGFPDVTEAQERINAIGLYNSETRSYIQWGLGELTKPHEYQCEYRKFDNELTMLRDFVEVFDKISPHILSGWHIEFFDVPYLVNRITKLLGETVVRRLSPFRKVYEKKTYGQFGKDEVGYEIMGVQVLDYLQIYKKFSGKNQESYSLDYIAGVELGTGKKDYSQWGSLREFYKNDYTGYLHYNLIDVARVLEIDNKNKYLSQILFMAYDAKCNYSGVFSMVKLWETAMYNFCLSKNIMTPMKKSTNIGLDIAGGYVKEVPPGQYNWVTTFDAESLYPHLILQYNISPEKLYGKMDPITPYETSVRYVPKDYNVLEGRFPVLEPGTCVAGNGAIFKTDTQGIIPQMIQKMFNDRKKFKGLMIEAQKAKELILARIKTEGKTDELAKELKRLENDESKYNNLQTALKLALNSCYGVMAQTGFFWFDTRLAEAVTLSGQMTIRKVGEVVNVYLNKLLKTEGQDFVVLTDTDSVGVNFEQLITKIGKGKSNQQIVDFLDRLAKNEFKPLFENKLSEFAHSLGCLANKINMKREAIADQMFVAAKKCYVINILDKEGVRFQEPKIVIKGMRSIKSDTPKVARDLVKETYKVIFKEGQKGMQEFIKGVEAKYAKFSLDEIAMPKSVSDVRKYTRADGSPEKGTPQHVRAAITYNQMIDRLGLEKIHRHINDGDKIKFLYLKEPNPFGSSVIGWSTSLPKEFGVDEWVDRQAHFERGYIAAIQNLTDHIGWSVVERVTLEDLFA